MFLQIAPGLAEINPSYPKDARRRLHGSVLFLLSGDPGSGPASKIRVAVGINEETACYQFQSSLVRHLYGLYPAVTHQDVYRKGMEQRAHSRISRHPQQQKLN
jgi:hypothetical protein